MSFRVQRRHKKGNPNWGKHVPLEQVYGAHNVAEFDRVVERLKLLPDQFAESKALKMWVKRNYKNHYVPEWLLVLWEFDVPFDEPETALGRAVSL